ncbi:uncharacterized protein LOC109541189 [Dendroctonus ponderosae]|uniref:Uncharacterized protein n=1 Tax=Dendroctonus ponderosae TaxID=77166 RepID=A0AAR5PX04_DENPD|nr:uncharacterized protein LOC109541189 [Dendroctonus ponderosae]KAH1023554.1 hypothetical protein HUJ04_012736 [Dendroctonus ponderosae]KAH1029989.1 hypothetical protein HUJ05_003130 [Dendroctonus ponderosae]
MRTLNIGFLAYLFICVTFLLVDKPASTAAQEPAFELPVELVGFPVIIVAVRLSNFVKKLAYSLNPSTYVSKRARRSLTDEEMINMIEAEKRLVTELGDNVCIYPKVCLHHAVQARKTGKRQVRVDWDDVFTNYKASKERQKEFYFLSVFLGDFIASPKFCNQLVKRGRTCTD